MIKYINSKQRQRRLIFIFLKKKVHTLEWMVLAGAMTVCS